MLTVIRYLVDLHSAGDPAWDCLLNQQAWLVKLLISCREDHQAKGKENQTRKEYTAYTQEADNVYVKCTKRKGQDNANLKCL